MLHLIENVNHMLKKLVKPLLVVTTLLVLSNSVGATATTNSGPILIVANPVRPVDMFGNPKVTDKYLNGITGTRIGKINTTKDWYTLANYTDTNLGATAWYVIDLTLDTAHNKMYWVDYYGINEGTIGGCGGKSTCAKLLYSTSDLGTTNGFEYVTGLGIDQKKKVLYAGVFNNTSKEYEIKQLPITKNLDGIKTLTSANHIPNGSGLGSIVYFQNKVYWTQDASDDVLDGVYWGSTTNSDFGTLVDGSGDIEIPQDVWGMAIDRKSMTAYFSSYFSTEPGPSGHIGSVSLKAPFKSTFGLVHIDCPSDQVAGPAGVAYDYHNNKITWGNWNYNSAGDPGTALATVRDSGPDPIPSVDRKCKFIETNQPDMLDGDTVVAHGQSGVVSYLYKPEFMSTAKASFKKKRHAELKCSATLQQDRPEAHLYISPSKVTYNWLLNGKKSVGHKSTLRAKKAGKYSCVVTAKNYAGRTVKKSKMVKVTRAQAK